MNRRNKRILERAGVGLFVMGAGLLARRATASTWQGVLDRPPPSDRDRNHPALREAMAWVVVSGVVVGLARLFARRGIMSRLSDEA
ncbi:MAG: DUF4235 domain-containing protein [Sphingomonadaceae bacterium]|nr:DUF4235 domain-containing protein [Sphingomonadaceae bacterium]